MLFLSFFSIHLLCAIVISKFLKPYELLIMPNDIVLFCCFVLKRQCIIYTYCFFQTIIYHFLYSFFFLSFSVITYLPAKCIKFQGSLCEYVQMSECYKYLYFYFCIKHLSFHLDSMYTYVCVRCIPLTIRLKHSSFFLRYFYKRVCLKDYLCFPFMPIYDWVYFNNELTFYKIYGIVR